MQGAAPVSSPAAVVDNVRGALCILVACLLFTLMGAIAKLLGERLPAIEIAFWRAFGGFVCVLPLAFRAGLGVWRTSRIGMHVTRGMLGTAGLVSGFYAITHLPLAEATALSFTKPLFQVLLAALVLRELVRLERWAATIVGFVGVVVMVAPGLGGGSMHPAVAVGLAGALCGALVSITLRRLVQLERELTILLYLGVVGSVATGLPTLLVWVTPTLREFALIALMSAIGMISQLFLMRGFRLGEASAMAPFDYSRLPFSAVAGFVLFAELPGVWTWAGAAVIVASSLYIAHREARLARRA